MRKPKYKGRTVLFQFEQKGVNAHKAGGRFVYDTPANAKKAKKRLENTPGFSNVYLI